MSTDPIWLLRVDWAGRSWFHASAPAEPVDERGRFGTAGAALRHRPGLSDVELVEAVDLGAQESTGEQSARCVVIFETDVATLVAQGWDLTRAVGELSLWTPGSSYGAREVLFSGEVAPDNIPREGEALTLSLVPPDLSEGAQWPGSDVTVTSGITWPQPADSAEGQTYPWPWGAPGFTRSAGAVGGLKTNVRGTPAPLVDRPAGIALIALGHVLATEVQVYSVPDDATVAATVILDSDARGRRVSTVDLSLSGFTLDDSADLWVQWYNSLGVIQYTNARSDSTEPLTRLGDVILQLLRYQRIPVDAGSFAAARRTLQAIRTSGHLAGEVPWAYVQDHLMPLAPTVWLLQGPRGVRAIHLDDRAPEHAPLVEVGTDLYRPPGVGPALPTDQSQGVVRATARYGLDGLGDGFVAEAITAARRERGETAAVAESIYAKRAANRGGAATVTLESAALYDRTAAFRASSLAVAARRGAPVENVLTGPLAARQRYRVGQRLRLTDADYGYAALPVWVTGLRYTTSAVEVMTQHWP